MGAIRGSPVAAGDFLLSARTQRYICRSCQETFLKSQVLRQQKRHASNDLPFTEKIRRKIWGTDNPPGLKDPYGGPSFLERAMDRKASRTTPQQSTQLLQPDDEELKQVPRERTADTPQRKASAPSEQYVPAETWDGLDHIGTTGDWRSLPAVDEDIPSSWRDRYVSSESFPTKETDFASLVCSMHQAIVESLACKTSGYLEPNYYYPRDDASAFKSIRITVSEDGTLSGLAFDSETNKATFYKLLSGAHVSSKPSIATQNAQVVDATEDDSEHNYVPANEEGNVMPEHNRIQSPELPRSEPAGEGRKAIISWYTPNDQSFLNARFTFDSSLTFTILKRFSGLSGLTIPDPILNSIMSGNKPVSHLLHQLTQLARPKPKTIAERLARSKTLLNQSNVMVLPRRETSVDKEKEVGRWKIIEKELTDRGLPVLGRAQVN